MAKALKVKAVDTIVGDTELVIKLVHESSETIYTARLSSRNDRAAVDALLFKVFKCDGLSILLGDKNQINGKYATYIPDTKELRSFGEVFPFDGDYRKGITEKEYDLTAKFDAEYAELYRRIRGEVAK